MGQGFDDKYNPSLSWRFSHFVFVFTAIKYGPFFLLISDLFICICYGKPGLLFEEKKKRPEYPMKQ